MNEYYVRKQIKQAMDLIGNIDLTEQLESYAMKRHKQKNLNEAYSILFDLENLYKLEGETDDEQGFDRF